jgi:CubicO group peptidase (beta-lactamase class C family)
MSGGFPQDDPWGDRKLAETDAQLDALVARGLTAASPTGTRWEYSNLGYALLGRIVTRVAREPYQAYITRRILKPLGMTNTVYENPCCTMAVGEPWAGSSPLSKTSLATPLSTSMPGLRATAPTRAR